MIYAYLLMGSGERKELSQIETALVIRDGRMVADQSPGPPKRLRGQQPCLRAAAPPQVVFRIRIALEKILKLLP